jgi:hypothetical protein
MNGFRYILAAMLFVALSQGAALAGPLARDANIWDGMAHEPNPALVHSEEATAGVQLSPQQQARQNNAVEDLAHQLLQRK